MSDRNTFMDHLTYLPDVAKSDLEVLAAKEATYQGSWKRAGGRSAWFMFRRNMDRLISMMAPPKFPEGESFSPGDMQDLVRQAALLDEDEITLSAPVASYLYQCWEAEDLFRKIEGASSGADGTVLACLRDLRRYAMLVEAEMLAQGVVEAEEPGDGGEAALALVKRGRSWSILGVEMGEAEEVVVAHHAGTSERHLTLSALMSTLRLLQPEWDDVMIERSAHHAIAHNSSSDIYTMVAFLTGEDRDVVKQRAYDKMYGGPLAKPQDATLGERISKAIRHAVNYHGLDARLNTSDHVIADLITPEVVRHLENRTDVQLVEAGWTPGPSGEPVPPGHRPGTPEDGGHHAGFTDGGPVPSDAGTIPAARRPADCVEAVSDAGLAVLHGITSREQARLQSQARARREIREATRSLSKASGRFWSTDFSRMREEVLACITDPVSDVVCLTMQMHHSHEEITVRVFLRGGQLSFETIGAGIQASGEANNLVLGRLFDSWCIDDLPETREPREPTSQEIKEMIDQLPSLEDILEDSNKAREAAGDPPGLQDGDPMTVHYGENGK